jgi:23S rRNA-intervening sequence protein
MAVKIWQILQGSDFCSKQYNNMRFQDLLAYKKSFELAMEIFRISKKFPSEEKY